MSRYGQFHILQFQGGHIGFMQIIKNAQGYQSGTRQILIQDHFGNQNPLKYKSYTPVPGLALLSLPGNLTISTFDSTTIKMDYFVNFYFKILLCSIRSGGHLENGRHFEKNKMANGLFQTSVLWGILMQILLLVRQTERFF